MDEATKSLLNVLFLFGFAAVFVGVWIRFLHTSSLNSGWTQLANQYHCKQPFKGTTARFQSAVLNGVSFTGLLVLGANNHGLFMEPIPPFRLFHKPLLIPWTELQIEPLSSFPFKRYLVLFKSQPDITMEVRRSTLDRLGP
ncbi:MAG: hypothetical protein KDC35_17305 [Acidobacteria bacterium]|nr:hypothetical protein [Acidobacteriota bacterium]